MTEIRRRPRFLASEITGMALQKNAQTAPNSSGSPNRHAQNGRAAL
jgi:hypothetical protein